MLFLAFIWTVSLRYALSLGSFSALDHATLFFSITSYSRCCYHAPDAPVPDHNHTSIYTPAFTIFKSDLNFSLNVIPKVATSRVKKSYGH